MRIWTSAAANLALALSLMGLLPTGALAQEPEAAEQTDDPVADFEAIAEGG